MSVTVENVLVKNIRFPTSLDYHGSDAMHTAPDYACAYVILETSNPSIEGHGSSFTAGRGTELVCSAIKSMAFLVRGKDMNDITRDFAGFWRSLTSDGQLRWLGPEKGILHLATASIVNALWDIWAKMEKKPLWKLLVDMEPEELISTMDFRYIDDVLSQAEALEILRAGQKNKNVREQEMRTIGFPAYITSAGWLGYSDETIKKRCHQALEDGFTKFKMKVGTNLEDDIRRSNSMRAYIGENSILMTDANQVWGVQDAIDWMKQLAASKPLFIEEPTSPDDVLGHAVIAKGLEPYGIKVATGEMCHNRVMFKQFLQAKAMDFCQIDACRMGGVNEILTVILMAKKFNIPVCPHAGGTGLCEMVQHLSIFDYICVSKCLENRMIEYADHLHEHYVNPVKVSKGSYHVPNEPGYSTEMKASSRQNYEYPTGKIWTELVENGKYSAPDLS